MYESNNKIGDEIRYVFDRQKTQNKIGNTLDKPTLLMRRSLVQSTVTSDEVVQKGTEYKKHDMKHEVAAVAH